MKKYLLVIVGFILGIVCTSYAAYKLKAEQVSFDKTNTGLNSDDVQAALDELSEMVNTNTNNLKKVTKSGSTNFCKENTNRKTININFSDLENYKELTIDNFSAPYLVSSFTTNKGSGIVRYESMSYNDSTGIISVILYYDTTSIGDSSCVDISIKVDCFYVE